MNQCENCKFGALIGGTMMCGNNGKVVAVHNPENGCIYASDKRNNSIKDSGERTEFDTGAVRDMHTGKGRMDLLPWLAIIEISKHCENGALKYGEHNVDRGIPMSSLFDSAMRHAAKYASGYDDEPHDLAAAWNLLWTIEMRLRYSGDKKIVNFP